MKKTVAGIPGNTMPNPPRPQPINPRVIHIARARGAGCRAAAAGRDGTDVAADAGLGSDDVDNPVFIGGTGRNVEFSVDPGLRSARRRTAFLRPVTATRPFPE